MKAKKKCVRRWFYHSKYVIQPSFCMFQMKFISFNENANVNQLTNDLLEIASCDHQATNQIGLMN